MVLFEAKEELFLSSNASRISMETTHSVSSKIKWPVHETDLSLASNAYVENKRRYTAISTYIFLACTLAPHTASSRIESSYSEGRVYYVDEV
jgi:hypothetical protein